MPASFLDFLAGGLLQFGFWELALYLLVATQLTIFSVTRTEPVSATRPTSLRPRSISITCSARSFGSASSSSARRASSSGVAPRGRVPAIGRSVIAPPETRTMVSGEAPTTWWSPKSK